MFGPEDDDDFTPVGSSKLASIFGQPAEDGNLSLTYTAPKQPKKSIPEPVSKADTSTTKLTIIIVQAVQTYKLEEGNYNHQGKLGAAVLGDIISKLYQLLLYKSKQQQITVTKITDKFQFIVQAKNFASFYDDRGQNWSIMFDGESGAVNFAREIGLARACALSEKKDNPFYVQDLKIGEGPPAEIGDLLEIRYTTSPLVNGKVEKAIETNVDADKPQRVKIRKGVWEEALIGATKGCKKFIVLAPILFGPWKPLADPNNRLVVEVEIGRIKACRRSRESTPVDILRHSESPDSNIDSSTDETSIKARGASISEALTNSPKTNKASIISRMARMGQATLPLKGSFVCNPSDSEETEEESSGAVSKATASPKTILKPRNISAKRSTPASHTSSPGPISHEEATTHLGNVSSVSGSASLPSQQLSIFQPTSFGWHQPHLQQPQTHPQQYVINGAPFTTLPEAQLYPATQVIPVPTVVSTPSGTPSEPLSIYFSESRTHNSEIRMGLTKVVDKVDQVLEKLDSLHQPSVGVMDPRTLLASIQKLVVENEQLRVELADKRIKLEQQNEKMYQLLHHKFLEQSSSSTTWDQRQDPTLQAVIVGLQQEKTKLATELNESVATANSLQIQATNFEKITIDLQEEINKLTARLQGAYLEIERGKQSIIEQENFIRSLKERTDASVNLNGTQDSIINNLKVNIQELETAKSLLEAVLMESKKQLEDSSSKFSEEISTLKASFQVEMELIKKNHEEQLQSCVRESVKGDESNGHHQKQVDDLVNQIDSLEKEVAVLQRKLQITSSSSIEDLKRVMNVMFRHMKSQFVPETSYDGSAIREIILSAIQDITLEYVNMKMGTSVKENRKQNVNYAKDPSTIIKNSVPSAPNNHKSEVNNTSKTADYKQASTVENIAAINMKDSDAPTGKTENDTVEAKGNSQINPKEQDETPCVSSDAEKEPTIADENMPAKTKDESEEFKQKLDEKKKSEEDVQSSLQEKEPRESSVDMGWKPQPPPPPLFDDEEDDDDWLS